MNLLPKRRVKIVCTLGPASQSVDQIERLIQAGMNVARLNFSHGSHAFHRSLIQNIRTASEKLRTPIGILQDLQGPKIRVGSLPPQGIELKAGDHVVLYPEGSTPRMSTHGRKTLPISAEIAQAVAQEASPKSRVLFDDGRLLTHILEVSAPEILVEVEVGGILTSHKGMNFPGTPLSLSCLTEKDLEDLKFGLSQGVDAVALSFVRTAQDILDLKRRIHHVSEVPLIIPKIEREEAIEYQESIIEISDGLLIARGDMAVEIGAEKVPGVQKDLIHACNEMGVPVITATQMLESMIASPTPTRAEASDVANAVFDGTDAVMLSAETASGKYPIESVQTMTRIILEAERTHLLYSRHSESYPVPGSVVDAIENSAAKIAEQVGASAIACITHSGMAVRTLAKYRPETPIVAIVDQTAILRKLSFVWGVEGELIPEIVATDALFSMVESVLQKGAWAKRDELVVVTAGVPSLKRGTTNMVKVQKMGALGSSEEK